MIYQSIIDLIGNTPILYISPKVHQIPNVSLYCKLEYYNPFGSIKDRMAWSMLKPLIDDLSQSGGYIVDSSSGNTIKAIQGIANLYNVQAISLTNRISVKQKKKILTCMGTKIKSIKSDSSFDDIQNSIETLRNRKNNTSKLFHTSQYTNIYNQRAHYEHTAEELHNDITHIDYIVGGLGTAGSLGGTSRKLKKYNKNIKVLGVCGIDGETIPGLRTYQQMKQVGLFTCKDYDDILPVALKDAILHEIKLMKSTGIMAGPSTGASYAAIKNYFLINPPKVNTNVVFFACDRMEIYAEYIIQKCKLYNIIL